MSLANVIQDLVVRIRYVSDREGLERSRTAISNLRSGLRSLAGVAALGWIGTQAWKTASSLEAAEAQFTTMLGSASAAKNMMKEMWDYAAMSTFEMRDVTHSMTTMLSYGMGQEQSLDTMKRLGDVAGANGPKFQRLALAMAQMQAKTRLTGEEVRQFVNAGWNPLRQVADMFFGGNMAEAEEQMRKRKVSAEMVFAALKKVTDEGGRFHGNQIRQSLTLTGVFTTMMDRIKMTLAQMLMAFSTPLKAIMKMIGLFDMSLVIKSIEWLSLAMQYFAKVVWQSGLQEGWDNFVFGLTSFVEGVREAGGPTETFGSILRGVGVILGRVFGLLGSVIGFLAWALVVVIRPAVVVFRELGNAIRGFVWYMESAWVILREVIKWLFAIVVAIVVFKAAFAAFFGFMSGSIFMVAALSGAVTGLSGAFAGLVGLFPALIAGLAAFLGPVGASVALVLTLGWAMYRLINARDEWFAGETQAQEDAARGKVEDQLNQRSRELDEAEKTGDKEKIAAAKKRWMALRDAYKKVYVDKKFDQPEAQETSFEAFVQRKTTDAESSVKKMVEQTGGKTNISNKVDFKVDVKGDPNAKTGLSAGEVAMLAERAARASFSISLEQALEGTI